MLTLLDIEHLHIDLDFSILDQYASILENETDTSGSTDDNLNNPPQTNSNTTKSDAVQELG